MTLSIVAQFDRLLELARGIRDVKPVPPVVDEEFRKFYRDKQKEEGNVGD